MGIKISQIISISDKKTQILKTLDNAITNSDLIIITGGLGPTNDDITKNTLVEFFDSNLILNKEVLSDVEKIIGNRGAKMMQLNVNQAMVPDNCKVLRNSKGTAPGMWFEKEDSVIISLPGVPFEMKAILNKFGFPLIRKHFKTPVILHKIVHTTGIPESELADKLKDWEKELHKDISLAYLPSPGDNKLRLDITGHNESELHTIINTEIDKLKQIIPEAIFGYNGDTIEKVVSNLLTQENLSISTAESCTGGKIASMLTSISGSSSYFRGSVVAYSNQIKQKVLGVSPEKLDKFGAVSEEVVKEMADGVRKLMNTDISIATSGIAGPGGGTKEKPVGTVWIAISHKEQTLAIKYLLGNARRRNIRKTSVLALNYLRKLLTKA